MMTFTLKQEARSGLPDVFFFYLPIHIDLHMLNLKALKTSPAYFLWPHPNDYKVLQIQYDMKCCFRAATDGCKAGF